MKDSEIYRKAARRIASNMDSDSWCSCLVVDSCAEEFNSQERQRYCETFGDEMGHLSVAAFDGHINARSPENYRLGNELRILALLFMSAICESEGR